jgi:hypothetical protein
MSFDALDSPQLRGFHRRLTVLSAAGMFLDGFDLTVIAVALPFLVKEWLIAPSLAGVVASSAVVGMLFGSLILGHLTDRIGRKAMYVVDLICFVVFAALTALSQNVWEFIAFRFLLGVGIGADYPISTTLLAEFVPASRRGAFVTSIGACWFFGAVAAYLVGYFLLPVGPDAWRWMLFIGAAIALVVIFFRSQIPESPRWLASRARASCLDRHKHHHGNHPTPRLDQPVSWRLAAADAFRRDLLVLLRRRLLWHLDLYADDPEELYRWFDQCRLSRCGGDFSAWPFRRHHWRLDGRSLGPAPADHPLLCRADGDARGAGPPAEPRTRGSRDPVRSCHPVCKHGAGNPQLRLLNRGISDKRTREFGRLRNRGEPCGRDHRDPHRAQACAFLGPSRSTLVLRGAGGDRLGHLHRHGPRNQRAEARGPRFGSGRTPAGRRQPPATGLVKTC